MQIMLQMRRWSQCYQMILARTDVSSHIPVLRQSTPTWNHASCFSDNARPLIFVDMACASFSLRMLRATDVFPSTLYRNRRSSISDPAAIWRLKYVPPCTDGKTDLEISKITTQSH